MRRAVPPTFTAGSAVRSAAAAGSTPVSGSSATADGTGAAAGAAEAGVSTGTSSSPTEVKDSTSTDSSWVVDGRRTGSSPVGAAARGCVSFLRSEPRTWYWSDQRGYATGGATGRNAFPYSRNASASAARHSGICGRPAASQARGDSTL